MTSKKVIDCFEEFFSRTAADNNTKDQLFLAAGLVELARRAKSKDTVAAMAEVLSSMPEAAWHNINFSLTHTLLGEECKARVAAAGVQDADVLSVLHTAFKYFVDAAESSSEPLSKELLLDLVEGVAADHVATKARPAKKNSPEVFNSALVSRAFAPGDLSAAVLKTLQVDVAYFRGELPGARLGPDTLGVMFNSPVEPSLNLILETGEYVCVKTGAINVAVSDDSNAFKQVPPSLLLATTLASVNLFMRGVIDKDQESALNAGILGKIRGPHHIVNVSTADLQPLEHVFNQARDSGLVGACGATGPIGASVRFPVPGTDMAVVIDARTGAHGAYGVSKLLRVEETGEDTVIMRHDMPRLFTTKGVYIFPTKDDGLVSLTAIF